VGGGKGKEGGGSTTQGRVGYPQGTFRGMEKYSDFLRVFFLIVVNFLLTIML